jgi:choline/glycine/proline betaine transport protein
VWQTRLKALLGHHNQQTVREYLRSTVRPAMEAVAEQLRAQSLYASIEESGDEIQLQVGQEEVSEFFYKVQLRKYSTAAVAFPEIPRKSQERSYWRAEVYLVQGPQHYDVAGYSRDQLVNDILNQFELHLQHLHCEH